METIKIRDVRGDLIEELAQAGKLVGITNNRVLVGVLCPVTQRWIEHVVEMNYSRLQQNLPAGEREVASKQPLTTLDELLESQEEAEMPLQSDSNQAGVMGAFLPDIGKMVTATTSGAIHVAGALHALLTACGPGSDKAEPQTTSIMEETKTVRIGDLSGAVIEKAGRDGQMILVTNDRVLVGIIVPVTKQLVAHVVEQNLSRVMYNITQGEREVKEGHTSTLEDVLREADQDSQDPSPVHKKRVRNRHVPS
ncbi:hypothetical protein [Rhodococcus aetherivorans]|uniref:hypothetical protein n=1 Tax=Rhodococcus aetherivorans TaxID=191292 RepID=UPI0012608F9B|nr:hypothetical protein [Rhodococcus aetherivorans]NGP27979.1 hypothetical protein [Rhodococcus aetherivorans]